MDQRAQIALQHLQEAVDIASELGLTGNTEGLEQRNQAVQVRIAELEPTKTTAIARTLARAAFFDDLVVEQVSRAQVAAEHLRFSDELNSLRDLLRPLEADPLLREAAPMWEAARAHFETLQARYEAIGAAALQDIEREHGLQEVYREFRKAVKEAESIALELLETAFARYNTARQKVQEDDEREGGATLLERLIALQDEERRWGVARDVVNRLVSASADSDIVLGRLTQSTAGKERLYWQSQAFIGSVATLLDGFPRALEVEGSDGDRVSGVKSLRMSVEVFQQRTRETAEEIEALAAEAALEIAELRADSEHRLSRLTAEAPAAPR